MQVTLGDLPGRGFHRAQRAQHAAGDQPAGHDSEPCHDRQSDAAPDEQLVKIMLALGEPGHGLVREPQISGGRLAMGKPDRVTA